MLPTPIRDARPLGSVLYEGTEMVTVTVLFWEVEMVIVMAALAIGEGPAKAGPSAFMGAGTQRCSTPPCVSRRSWAILALGSRAGRSVSLTR